MIVGVLTTCHTTRSPDATRCDFLLWGYVKDQVYDRHAATPPRLVYIQLWSNNSDFSEGHCNSLKMVVDRNM